MQFDNFQQVVLPRRYRTTVQTVPQKSETEDCTLFTKQCIHSYSMNWNIVHYKYSAYSGTYAELPKLKANDLKEETYEIDVDTEAVDELKSRIDGITKEGYLMKGPEIGNATSSCVIELFDVFFFLRLRQDVCQYRFQKLQKTLLLSATRSGWNIHPGILQRREERGRQSYHRDGLLHGCC